VTTSLNPKQLEAVRLTGGDARHVLLYGGSRSGKTFIHCRTIAIRALKAAQSRHAVLRFRFNAVKESVFMDTWPKMMGLCFPEVKCAVNKSDYYVTFPNGSEVWFGGLDDKDRTEKILGKEYATILFNEVSQIPWGSVETAHTRLAQKTALKTRALYDENPPKKGHWSYKLFVRKVDPNSGNPLPDPENYVAMKLSPEDNLSNIAPEYLTTLRSLSGARRKRFYDGEFAEDAPNALFSDTTFDKHRHLGKGSLPEWQRVIVAVDPSGASDENSEGDAIGIVVMALGTDGRAYLLEDLTILAGPKVWGGVVAEAFKRHAADMVVGETNYGGDMVRFVVQAARPDTPFKKVTATRGKVVRAEPISYLVSDGKVCHVGHFPELEEELCAFTSTGYAGENSPNRADAYVWALTELFPGMTEAKSDGKPKLDLPKPFPMMVGAGGWMAG
jgi:phage terminase large subunit-like protein